MELTRQSWGHLMDCWLAAQFIETNKNGSWGNYWFWGLTERAKWLVAPVPPKSEGDIVDAVVEWFEQDVLLSQHKGLQGDADVQSHSA